MQIIENLVIKIDNNVFFRNINTGFSGCIGDNFFIPSLNTAFLEPSLEMKQNGFNDADWLPSSPLDHDPFYGKIAFGTEIREQRNIITRSILDAFEKIDKNVFVLENNDFSKFAKNSISFAFRQYILEKNLDLGNKWSEIVALYFDGHWPVAFNQNKIFVL